MVNSVLLASSRSHSLNVSASPDLASTAGPTIPCESSLARWRSLKACSRRPSPRTEKADQYRNKEIATPHDPNPPAATSAKLAGLAWVGGNDVPPEPRKNVFHQPGAFGHGRATVAGGLELPLDARRFVALREPRSSLIKEDAAIMNVFHPSDSGHAGGSIHHCLSDAFRSRPR